jgi:hypothetical protein
MGLIMHSLPSFLSYIMLVLSCQRFLGSFPDRSRSLILQGLHLGKPMRQFSERASCGLGPRLAISCPTNSVSVSHRRKPKLWAGMWSCPDLKLGELEPQLHFTCGKAEKRGCRTPHAQDSPLQEFKSSGMIILLF